MFKSKALRKEDSFCVRGVHEPIFVIQAVLKTTFQVLTYPIEKYTISISKTTDRVSQESKND